MRNTNDPRNAPPDPGFPIHRLNSGQTIMWISMPVVKRQMAANLVKKYRGTGVGVLSGSLRLISLVQPNEVVRDLPPPHVEYQMWQVANAPQPKGECACRTFHDPEYGMWKDRPLVGHKEHHPFCQFSKTSVLAYSEAYTKGFARVKEGLSPQARPDEWQLIDKGIKGR